MTYLETTLISLVSFFAGATVYHNTYKKEIDIGKEVVRCAKSNPTLYNERGGEKLVHLNMGKRAIILVKVDGDNNE